jgi:hypothetical protein
MDAISSLDQALTLAPEQYDLYWSQIDALVRAVPPEEQVALWHAFANRVGSSHSKGHSYFRLGILTLMIELDELKGIRFLELAYEQDQQFGPRVRIQPHRMGAYKLLSLTKEYFRYLREAKDWQQALLTGRPRRILIETLFMVYDRSLVEVLDMPSFTYPAFSDLMKNQDLRAFAIENYYCGESLIQMFFLEGQAISKARDEYPLSRAVVGLLAGVLEALLVERLPDVKRPTLGGLLTKAHERNVLEKGTRASALSSLMLHLRNYIHADLGSQRTDYFIDINTAKGCKVALDWALAELLQQQHNAPR